MFISQAAAKLRPLSVVMGVLAALVAGALIARHGEARRPETTAKPRGASVCTRRPRRELPPIAPRGQSSVTVNVPPQRARATVAHLGSSTVTDRSAIERFAELTPPPDGEKSDTESVAATPDYPYSQPVMSTETILVGVTSSFDLPTRLSTDYILVGLESTPNVVAERVGDTIQYRGTGPGFFSVNAYIQYFGAVTPIIASGIMYEVLGLLTPKTLSSGDLIAANVITNPDNINDRLLTAPKGSATWTLTRSGDYNAFIEDVRANGLGMDAYVFAPGVYTFTVTGDAVGGQTFTSDPIIVGGPIDITASPDCLSPGEQSSVTAYAEDLYGSYIWPDVNFTWSLAPGSLQYLDLTAPTGTSATVQAKDGGLGIFRCAVNAAIENAPDFNASVPMQNIFWPGLSHPSTLTDLTITPASTDIHPGAHTFTALATDQSGQQIEVPVFWDCLEGSLNGSFAEATGASVAYENDATFHDFEILTASICDLQAELDFDVCYDVTDFDLAAPNLTVAPGGSIDVTPVSGSTTLFGDLRPKNFADYDLLDYTNYPRIILHAPASPRTIDITVGIARCDDPVFESYEKAFTITVAPPSAKDRLPIRTQDKQDPNINKPESKQRAASVCVNIGDVWAHNGEEHVDPTTDLFVRGRGEIDFRMQRMYRSRILYDGDLGKGWDFSYSEHLVVQQNGDVAHVNGFGRYDVYVKQPDGSFLSPPEFFSVLHQSSDGGYVLREVNGFKRWFLADGKLDAHEDRHGNTLSFAYDANGHLASAKDPFQRVYTFTWTDDGRLHTVSDFGGRTVTYTYNTLHQLVSVATPPITGTSTGNDFPTGRTTVYTYSSGFSDPDLNDNLLTITEADEVASGGPAVMTVVYGTDSADPSTYDKVKNITLGGTNESGVPAGGVYTFEYAVVDPVSAGVPPEVVKSTKLTDAAGNQTVYFFDGAGRVRVERVLTRGLRTGDPAYYQTQKDFDADSNLVRITYPAGNSEEFDYDTTSAARYARGNLLERRQIADATRGGGSPLVTRFSYEPLYNQVATISDAREFTPGYAASIGTVTSGRYTTKVLFDYQEGTGAVTEATEFGIDISGVPRGLGDLNLDGRTDQTAGDVVLTQAPTVKLLAGSNEAVARGDTNQKIEVRTAWNDAGQPLATIDAEGNLTNYEYHPENDPDGDGVAVSGNSSTVASGYLKATVVDAATTPLRRTTRPAAAIRTSFVYDALGRVASVKNPRGVVSMFEWNACDELVSTTRATDTSDARANGQLLLDNQNFAYKTRFFYDAVGNRTKLQIENRDSKSPDLGQYIEHSYDYDILDHLVSETAQVDSQTTATTLYRYTANELPRLVVKPEGNQTSVAYDERNLVFTKTRGFGATTVLPSTVTYNYDLNGNVAEVLDPEHKASDGTATRTTITRDGFDRVTRVTDALGDYVQSDYDPVSAVVKQQVYGHPAGQPTAAKILLSEQRFSRDELSRVFQQDVPIFLAEGTVTHRPFEPREGSLTPSDGLITTRFEFDALSRRTFLVEDDKQTSSWQYDGASRLAAAIDPLGNFRETFYDQNSNPTKVRSTEISPENLVPAEIFETLYVFDSLDRLARVTDNAGQTSTLSYDSRNNVTDTSDAVGALVQDPLNLYIRGQINSAGNTCHYFHDAMNRLVKKVHDLRVGGSGDGALSGTITNTFVFDKNSRLTAALDDKGNTTVYQFDDLDRPTVEIAADLSFRKTDYDRDDNPIKTVDANGTVTIRNFDALNRLTRVDVTPSATYHTLGTTGQTFEYDGASRLTRASDEAPAGTSEVTYAYDSLSRQLEEVQDGRTVSSVWAGDGRRLACTYASGTRFDFQHDASKRLKSIAQGSSTVVAWNWIGPGLRPLTRATENGVTLTFLNDAGHQDIGWDAVQRPTRMRYKNASGAALVDLGYGYDRANNRVRETRRHESRRDTFTYDSAYRLDTAKYNVDASTNPSPTPVGVLDVTHETFSFDGANNRLSLTQKLDELQADGTGYKTKKTDYATNATNEYTSVGNSSHTYDANGNLVEDERFCYFYDFRNLLVELHNKSTGRKAVYRYDALGRRIEKNWGDTVPDPADPCDDDGNDSFVGTVHVQRYVYDGARIVEQVRSNGTYARQWVFGVGIDEPIRMARNPGRSTEDRFYYAQNAIGSVVALCDAAGAIVERYKYLAFGKDEVQDADGTTLSGSAVGNPIRFQGRWRDSAEGSPLYYYRARFFDPREGRFTTRDPIDAWGDPMQTGNAYGALGNNGVNRTDATGLIGADPVTIGVVATYGATQLGAGTAGVGAGVTYGGVAAADYAAITGGAAAGASSPALGGALVSVGAATGIGIVGGAAVVGGFAAYQTLQGLYYGTNEGNAEATVQQLAAERQQNLMVLDALKAENHKKALETLRQAGEKAFQQIVDAGGVTIPGPVKKCDYQGKPINLALGHTWAGLYQFALNRGALVWNQLYDLGFLPPGSVNPGVFLAALPAALTAVILSGGQIFFNLAGMYNESTLPQQSVTYRELKMIDSNPFFRAHTSFWIGEERLRIDWTDRYLRALGVRA